MKINLKKGKYYIGDPCYVFNESWSDVLDITHHFYDGDKYKIKNYTVVGASTAYGDGIYEDNFERKYAVDAGLIAIMPVGILKIDNKITKKEIMKSDRKHIIDFKEDFSVECGHGKFLFGDIEIDTNESDENDEDEYVNDEVDDEEYE